MSKRSIGLVVVMCLMAALFAFPAFAQAAPVKISGKVLTVGDAVIAHDGYVALYRWNVKEQVWKVYSATWTDDTGAYSVMSDDAPTATNWKLRAWDTRSTNLTAGFIGGTFLGAETAPVSPAADVANVDIRVTMKDNVAPVDLGINGLTSSSADRDDYFINDDYRDISFWADDALTAPVDVDWTPWFSEGSGIASISYSINGDAWVTAESSRTPNFDSTWWNTPGRIRLTDEGVHTVAMKATDRLGNVSKIKSGKVRIDRTAPWSSYDAAKAKGTSITLMTSDALSGANATYWRHGTTGKFTFGTVAPVPAVAAGTLIEFYSVDKAGNVEQVKQMTAKPAASLSKPKASTSKPKAKKTFHVTGSVSSRSAAKGTLRVYKLTNGKYKEVSKKSFKEATSGKYKVAMKLSKGTYKFKAFYGANTATMSDPLVASARSAKVVVK